MSNLSFDNIYYNGMLIGLCGVTFNIINTFIISKVPLKNIIIAMNFTLLFCWVILVILNILELEQIYVREFIQIAVFYGGASIMYPIVYIYPSKIFPPEHRAAVNGLVITGSQLIAAFFPLIGHLATLIG